MNIFKGFAWKGMSDKEPAEGKGLFAPDIRGGSWGDATA